MTCHWRASYSMCAAAVFGLVCIPDAGAQTYTKAPIELNVLIVGDLVMDMFASKLHARVIRVDASELWKSEASSHAFAAH